MKSEKGNKKIEYLKFLYVIGTLLLIMFFDGRMYNIASPEFFVPVIIVSLIIGLTGVYLFEGDMRVYKNGGFISFVMTIGMAFIPVLGVYIEGNSLNYGFPAQYLVHNPQSGFTAFNLIDFLFNFFVFYFAVRLVSKTVLKFSKKEAAFERS
ncbi:hypothetical protein [Alkalicoccus halolimnae]|uniref:Uncharacterized protein n=1 Tax=Alkalicoccus halolimnae TaxID=1667239 RepID=A0A5C7F4X0_9BACI|nr:hypothetical protein [Alkalicoccus halolimnae]TXF83331.1 hypothetical protein FTX54_13210 [Alkalicoccus halolimnae]